VSLRCLRAAERGMRVRHIGPHSAVHSATRTVDNAALLPQCVWSSMSGGRHSLCARCALLCARALLQHYCCLPPAAHPAAPPACAPATLLPFTAGCRALFERPCRTALRCLLTHIHPLYATPAATTTAYRAPFPRCPLPATHRCLYTITMPAGGGTPAV